MLLLLGMVLTTPRASLAQQLQTVEHDKRPGQIVILKSPVPVTPVFHDPQKLELETLELKDGGHAVVFSVGNRKRIILYLVGEGDKVSLVRHVIRVENPIDPDPQPDPVDPDPDPVDPDPVDPDPVDPVDPDPDPNPDDQNTQYGVGPEAQRSFAVLQRDLRIKASDVFQSISQRMEKRNEFADVTAGMNALVEAYRINVGTSAEAISAYEGYSRLITKANKDGRVRSKSDYAGAYLEIAHWLRK